MRAELKTHTLADLAQRVVDKASAGYGKQVVHWLSDRAANRRGDKASPSSDHSCRTSNNHGRAFEGSRHRFSHLERCENLKATLV